MSEILTDCDGWRAWLDPTAEGGPCLHVEGTCTAPTPGHSAELEPAEPQGINPQELLLVLVVHEPTGTVPQIVTPVKIDWSAHVGAREYSTVAIRGITGSIPIAQVASQHG